MGPVCPAHALTHSHTNTHTHTHAYTPRYMRARALASIQRALPFIRRKTLWCISFDAVCALVMQIPRRPALAAWIFRDTGGARCLFGRSREGWKFRIAKGALILICTSATARRITLPPCITHGSRMEIDCIRKRDGRGDREVVLVLEKGERGG